MSYLSYDAYGRLEVRYGLSSMPVNPAARVERTVARSVSNNVGSEAPWWSNVALGRVACNAGQPMPSEFVSSFEPLFTKLDEISGDEEDGVTAESAKAAVHLLQCILFAGYARPRMTWHGGDAVVFFWKAGRSATFLTVTGADLSILHEQNGKKVRRVDGIAQCNWTTIFA